MLAIDAPGSLAAAVRTCPRDHHAGHCANSPCECGTTNGGGSIEATGRSQGIERSDRLDILCLALDRCATFILAPPAGHGIPRLRGERRPPPRGLPGRG